MNAFNQILWRYRGVDNNTPNAEHEAHIVKTVENLLDPLCEGWSAYCAGKGLGKPGICISLGYCSMDLNKHVGGSATSAHCRGYAFDLVPANGKMWEFKCFCRDFLADKAFDQLISSGEDETGMPSWMHVGYKHPSGSQRRQILSKKGGKYCLMTD